MSGKVLCNYGVLSINSEVQLPSLHLPGSRLMNTCGQESISSEVRLVGMNIMEYVVILIPTCPILR